MLKNKKALYILIPVNILVWGFFVYRIFSAFNGEETPMIADSRVNINPKIISDTAVYKLQLNYKDPFLKDSPKALYVNTSERPHNSPKPPTEKKSAAPRPTKQAKVLPEIKYLGLIKNSSSGISTALITINGQSKLIKANEVVDGITVKSFDSQELVAFAGKEKIVVKKM